jgi:hypothetical protein
MDVTKRTATNAKVVDEGYKGYAAIISTGQAYVAA